MPNRWNGNDVIEKKKYRILNNAEGACIHDAVICCFCTDCVLKYIAKLRLKGQETSCD
jgi:hypothetical protein